MTEILNMIIAFIVGFFGIVGTIYGIKQYKDKKLKAKTDEAIKEALESKEILDISEKLKIVQEELEVIKVSYPQIIDAIESVKEIQVIIGQFEMRCNLLHKGKE